MGAVHSQVPGSHKAATGAQASHGKDKTLGGAAGTGDGGDFSSLMLTLGAQDAADSGPVVISDLPITTDVVTQVDPGLLLAQAVQIQPAAQLADKKITSELTVKTEAVTTHTPETLPATSALCAKTQLHADDKDVAVSLADAEKLSAPDASTTDTLKSALKDTESADQANHKVVVLDDSKQVKTKAELQSHELKTKLAESAVNAKASSDTASLPQLTQVSGQGEPGLRQSERLKERLALKQVGGSESGNWGYQALSEAGRIQAPSETSATASLPPEVTVAQQVNYWISHDVQNAELKFNGLGEGTVKVNISMQGNEASVEFRSDQVETRQILEGAVSHLKDLLGNEGLVLSSVSVGTSGSGGGNARHAPASQPVRQARVELAQGVAQDSVPRSPRASGRALDLFV